MAFVTRSSNATLPVTMRVSEEKLGLPRSITSFTLPLGPPSTWTARLSIRGSQRSSSRLFMVCHSG